MLLLFPVSHPALLLLFLGTKITIFFLLYVHVSWHCRFKLTQKTKMTWNGCWRGEQKHHRMHRCDKFSEKNKLNGERASTCRSVYSAGLWLCADFEFKIWTMLCNRLSGKQNRCQSYIYLFFVWRQHGSSWAGWSEISFCSGLVSCVSKLLISSLQLWVFGSNSLQF